MIKITNIKIYLLKYKNKNPVLSSFGNIKFRSSLVIEIHDDNNNNGIGEIWCNFPNHGGRYRFCLLYTSPSPRDDISSRMPSSA